MPRAPRPLPVLRMSGLLICLALGATATALSAAPEPALVVRVTDAATAAALPRARVIVWDEENLWQAVSDAEGRARFEQGPSGTVQVYVEAERHTAEEQHDVEVEPGRTTEVSLALGPGVPFEGTVLGPDGRPLAQARIEVEAGGTYEGYSEMKLNHAPYARTYADEAGRFRVLGIPPGAVGTVVVEVEGYESARVAVRAVGEAVRPSPLVIRLAKGSRVSGRVTAPDGSPAADATVLVVPAGDEELRANPDLVHSSAGGIVRALRAQTDGEGRYLVAGLALDQAVVVAARAAGFARSTWSEPLTPTAKQRELVLDLALRRAATLRVTLTDPEGKPVADARVQLGAGMVGRDAEPDEAPGTWRFDDLEPGTHALNVDRDGFLDVREPVEVEEGAHLTREIRLDRGAAIEGVVLDDQGRPAAGARIEAERKEPDPPGSGWHEIPAGRATCDAQGRFTLGGLRPGSHELSVYGENLSLLEPVLVKAPASGLTVKAARLGVVRLTLRAPAGAALPRSAYVWRHTPSGGGSGSGHRILPEGRMEFIGFRGPERLDIRVEGYVRVEREVDVKPGAQVDLGTIALEVGLTLKGHVRDPSGQPVAGAHLTYAGASEATSAEDGAFALEHLPAGPVLIEVDAEGFLALGQTLTVASEGPPVVLTLSRGALLTGVVKDAQGRPVVEHWFRVEGPAPERPSGWKEVESFGTDEQGRFEVRVPAAACRIAFFEERESVPVVLATLHLKEGETRRLELALK